MMGRSKAGIAFCVVWSMVAFCASLGFAAQSAKQGDKVAVVNGVPITKTSFDREMGRIEQQAAMSGQKLDPAKMAEMKKRVLNGLIDRELLYQESQKLGVRISDSAVNERMAALKKRFPNEADFNKALEQMNLSEADLKTQFTEDMAVKEFIDQKLSPKVKVTDADIKTFYDDNPKYFKMPERVRASHILIKVDPKATPAEKAKARAKLEKIQARIKKGEDFATLAKEYSDCPSSARGGDLDYFPRGKMVGPFEDAAFSLKKGQVSDIVETQFGYHLIKVTDKKPAGVVPLAEVKEKIKKYLTQEKTNELLTQYSAQLQKTAKIERFLQ